MLHDPSHYTPMVNAEEIRISTQDKDILRALAEQKSTIGALPVHTHE